MFTITSFFSKVPTAVEKGLCAFGLHYSILILLLLLIILLILLLIMILTPLILLYKYYNRNTVAFLHVFWHFYT